MLRAIDITSQVRWLPVVEDVPMQLILALYGTIFTSETTFYLLRYL